VRTNSYISCSRAPLPRSTRYRSCLEDARPQGRPRLYINFNAIFRGRQRPPSRLLGIDASWLIFGSVRDLLGIERQTPRFFIPDAGGRLFLDFTDLHATAPPPWKMALASPVMEPGTQQIPQRLIEARDGSPKVVLKPNAGSNLL